jgi:transposase InsO family protein
MQIKFHNKININHKVIENVFRQNHFRAHVKKHKKYDDPKTSMNIKNLICRDFTSTVPGYKFSYDVTYYESPHATQGYWYIGGAIDLYNDSIHGLNISDKNNYKLVLKTYKELKIIAINGAIINTDYGKPELHQKTQFWMAKYGFRQSCGKKGLSTENLPIEKF